MSIQHFSKIVFSTTFILILTLLIAALIYKWNLNDRLHSENVLQEGTSLGQAGTLSNTELQEYREIALKWFLESNLIKQRINGQFLEKKIGLLQWIDEIENQLLKPIQRLKQELMELTLTQIQREEINPLINLLNLQETWVVETISYLKKEEEEALRSAVSAKKEWIEQLSLWIEKPEQRTWIKKGDIRSIQQTKEELMRIYQSEDRIAFILY